MTALEAVGSLCAGGVVVWALVSIGIGIGERRAWRKYDQLTLPSNRWRR